MFKTIFNISKMDCPSEEQMIRLKLAGLTHIKHLRFDIPGRTLLVFHDGEHDSIQSALDSLHLDTSFISSELADPPDAEEANSREKKVLWQVLGINLAFFVIEMVAGIVGGSMGLVADSLDMLADSIVYGLALLAVGGAVARKKNVARIAGYVQLTLAFLGFAEIVRRFVGHGDVPDYQLMIVISLLALTANSICLYLLHKAKSKEAHMQASMIFTSMDVLINVGVILAGVMVFLTRSMVPDLIVGAIVFMLVTRGAYRILQLAKG